MTSYSELHESYCDTEDKQTNCVWVVFLYSSAAIKVGACRALAQLFEQVEGSVLRPHLPSVYVALSKLLQEVSQRNITLIFVNILLLGHWFEVIEYVIDLTTSENMIMFVRTVNMFTTYVDHRSFNAPLVVTSVALFHFACNILLIRSLLLWSDLVPLYINFLLYYLPIFGRECDVFQCTGIFTLLLSEYWTH